MYLGIEIGGTKLQLGIGRDDGALHGLWRGRVEADAGADGIRRQIVESLPQLLRKSGVAASELKAVGIGFGGPVDDATQCVIKSHHIHGWDGFPLADWVSDLVGLPAALGNDADVAGLAEALHGAGQGCSSLFYITIGTGIGGGLIVNGEIYRGVGRGAAEIGHLIVSHAGDTELTLESLASGTGIARAASLAMRESLSAQDVARRALAGDQGCRLIINDATAHLATALRHVITLLCPRRIVIGGGVSLMGEELFFVPLRRVVAQRTFPPFAGLTDIVPAALGEEVVVHGAIALIRKEQDRATGRA